MGEVTDNDYSKSPEGCQPTLQDCLINPTSSSIESDQYLTEEIIGRSLNINDWLTQAELTHDRGLHIQSLVRKGGKVKVRTYPLLILLERFIRKICGKISLEILEVTNLCLDDGEHFWGGWVDCPNEGDVVNGYVIFISGWVVGKKSHVTSISAVIGKTRIAKIPVDVLRPGVSQVYTFLKDIGNSGYKETLYISELPNEGTIRLEAVFADGSIVPVCVIKYCKY